MHVAVISSSHIFLTSLSNFFRQSSRVKVAPYQVAHLGRRGRWSYREGIPFAPAPRPDGLTALVADVIGFLGQVGAEVVMLDEMALGEAVFEVAEALQGRFPQVRLVVVMHEVNALKMALALQRGFLGVLSTQDELDEGRLIEMLNRVYLGKTYFSPTVLEVHLATQAHEQRLARLTPGRLAVLHLLLQGCSVAESARRLGLRKGSVYQFQALLRREFDAGDNEELVAKVRPLVAGTSVN